MAKKGGDFEIQALEFLEKIFKELAYDVVRRRIQLSGSQDGYDGLIEIVDDKYFSKLIYSECKDYTTELNYTDAFIKIPQLASTHKNIDLFLLISPRKDFTNIFEDTRNKPFMEALANGHFKVAVLSPETDVEIYFSLYPEIYKKVYRQDAPVLNKNQRQEILNQFDKFIFSDRNLHKIIIDERDKTNYIGKIEEDPFHIKRSVRAQQNREYEYYLPTTAQKTILSEIYLNDAGVILLGNPGFGKTSELKQLAAELWSKKDELYIIPFFKSIKNFTMSSSIEDFIPENFKLISRQIIIFDGVDEIENIIDFSSKLRTFINDYRSLFENKNIRLVISCRTNIYKKYIKNISDLGVYYLNEINLWTGLHFLESKFGLNAQNNRNFDIYKNKEILENPFYLELIGNHYLKHNVILTNKALLIGEYVDSRLKDDKANKFSNDPSFDKDQVLVYTKKIAFTFEAMQKPFLAASEIKKAAQVDEENLAKNPFLEENLADNWSFVLKNIQEYFVARVLSELSFDQIIGLIRIDSQTDKVHPTWHNVVTFLLNFIEDQKIYNALVDWLVDNDYELLFNADSDRIDDQIKFKLLSRLFKKDCIDDYLWINDPGGIASFGQCNLNIDYLLSQAGIISNHRRARMSALKILSNMNIPYQYSEQVKSLAIEIIQLADFSDEHYVHLIQDAMTLCYSMGLTQDTAFFNQIIALLRDQDQREIISSIISFVPVGSTIDNIDYFLEILEKTIGSKKWNSVSRYNSMSSTKERIFALFTKITDGAVLLKIYSFAVERQKNYQFRDSLVKEFLSYAKEYFASNKKYNRQLTKIITNVVIKDPANYYDAELLLEIVRSCEIEDQVFQIVLESIHGNSDSKHFLAEIATKDDFDKILKKYNDGSLDQEFLNQFRNVLSHRDFTMSKELETFIESKTEFIFADKFSQQQLEERNNYYANREQKNFDVLFDHKQIADQILELYHYIGKEDLNFKDIDKFYHRYYGDFELQKKVTENAKRLFYKILSNNYSEGRKLNVSDVQKEVFNSRRVIMLDVLHGLPKEKEATRLKISQEQKQFIKKWCQEMTPAAKGFYSKMISSDDKYHFYYDEDYHLFESIYKFQKYFHFDLDQELLLDMLWFNSHEEKIKTDYLDGVVPAEKIKRRISCNLQNAKLSAENFCNHLKYCRENNISIKELGLDLKSKVYEFLNNGNYHYTGELIENFFAEDLESLQEFLNYKLENNREPVRFLFDRISSLLIKSGREQIVLEFLTHNYSTLIAEDVFSEKEIVRNLIILDHPQAFENFYSIIKSQIQNDVKGEFDFRTQEWLRFTRAEALEMLVKTLYLCVSTKNLEQIFGDHYTPARICFDTIISICKANDESACTKALVLLNAIDSQKLEAQNLDPYYLNKLKNDIHEIFYSHKSKPYKMAEVLKLLDENKYYF
ncbi:NACHT domain-containing protein [Flavobacterium panici]|uniref:Novel STAND NTPase 3 domain-containing protein n=1 Tax=Flavobacterium panici TaxID=2654843 RepID=A0A9N8P1Q7_9FLAO|nr:hypothetical protein [Flavobacterium panici]CAC9974386.1 hypothetical protein FLAPXU55_02083 [Flavobacterium panici]